MIALALCILAFISCYMAGRRSLGQGLVALLTFGYFYGILRANLITTYSHFIFDAGMIGLFLSPRWRDVPPEEKKRSEKVLIWTAVLMLWPTLLLALPFQPVMISLVGLRGNIFFIPLLLLGSRLTGKDLIELSVGLALLDLVAVAFAVAEYFLGVPRFFPYSQVTLIMYSSADVAGGFLRIPATFTSAHAFGGTMVGTIPYLIGLWIRSEKRFHRWLALITLPLTLLGVLMSATRTFFVFAVAMILFVTFTTPMRGKQRALFLAIVAMVGISALSNERFQRFKSLGDTDSVTDRIAGSVNRDFWEILAEYPMGNGLGGGGTSIPYFLQGQVRNPIGMENEYAAILCEQGVIGLMIWLCFIGWFFSNVGKAFAKSPWSMTRRLVWCLAVISMITAWLGTGSLTAIPGTVLLMIAMGWTGVREPSGPSTSPGYRQPLVRSYGRARVPAPVV
jgi:hypothetical protein